MTDKLKAGEILDWVEANALYIHPYNPTWQAKLKEWRAQLTKGGKEMKNE